MNTAIGRDVTDALAVYRMHVLEASLAQRVAFAESIANGKTVLDLDPTGQPASRSPNWRRKFWSSPWQGRQSRSQPERSRPRMTLLNRKPEPEPEKPVEQVIRLSVDLPESLHTKLKVLCVTNRQRMTDKVRKLIERDVAEAA